MTKLSKKELLFVGLTLFSMFFGAGNLIFPPFLGEQAGSHAWIALIGFIVSAVGLPILGVIAVAKAGGLKSLASRVHPLFAFIFTLLIYLSIGPCLAIPRTASTSFEMAIVPFVGNDGAWIQVLYSLLFFGIALYMALKPEKLTDRLGKVLCPILLTLILVVFIGSFFADTFQYGEAIGVYKDIPLVQGFLDGYQTMDTIAALNFGIIIALNIQSKGLKDKKMVVSSTIKAGVIAGICLTIIYSILLHIGAMSGGMLGLHQNGAQTLNQFVSHLFGNIGMVILGAIFFIACLNTCIGLICCCSEYFYTIIPKISYKLWAFIFAFVSMVISNVGLDMILKISIPILNFLYPLSIVLIALAFLDKWLKSFPFVYQLTMLFTGIGSILGILPSLGLNMNWLSMIPLYNISLGWVVFSLIGFVLGILIKHKK
ncbi:MAG: branched-chain amino acid transport system II carrier protein [Coprobacillus sp.]